MVSYSDVRSININFVHQKLPHFVVFGLLNLEKMELQLRKEEENFFKKLFLKHVTSKKPFSWDYVK